jgi:hypothetical protein
MTRRKKTCMMRRIINDKINQTACEELLSGSDKEEEDDLK